jgi:hypothetical protein
MKRSGYLALALFSAFLTTQVHADEVSLPAWVIASGPPWHPPELGVVRDSKSAITIAHAIWFSMYPSLAERGPSGEDVWQSAMQATLKNGVWEVTGKEAKEDTVGGGLFIYIAKSDGRVVSIVLTQ